LVFPVASVLPRARDDDIGKIPGHHFTIFYPLALSSPYLIRDGLRTIAWRIIAPTILQIVPYTPGDTYPEISTDSQRTATEKVDKTRLFVNDYLLNSRNVGSSRCIPNAAVRNLHWAGENGAPACVFDAALDGALVFSWTAEFLSMGK
jgi:hypothetical protein